MKRARRIALALALVCFALAAVITLGAWRARSPAAGRASLLERLVGPFAALAASAQWVRADLALREGRFGVFCERAETALELAPSDPQGWIYYAHQLLFERASPLREPARETRESWSRAGIELLGRAEEECANPAEIWIYEGGVFAGWSFIPAEERPWPGDARELRSLAIEAFARARALGNPRAGILEQALRDLPAESNR
jgi:hypothetical protein